MSNCKAVAGFLEMADHKEFALWVFDPNDSNFSAFDKKKIDLRDGRHEILAELEKRNFTFVHEDGDGDYKYKRH